MEGLGGRERELISALFALGNRASAEEIRRQLRNPPTYSTVRVMLARLEKKGYLRHVEEGSKYVYSATTSPAAAAKRALQHYIRTFFNGSLAEMVTALVRDGSWTEEELRQLKVELERASKEDK